MCCLKVRKVHNDFKKTFGYNSSIKYHPEKILDVYAHHVALCAREQFFDVISRILNPRPISPAGRVRHTPIAAEQLLYV